MNDEEPIWHTVQWTQPIHGLNAQAKWIAQARVERTPEGMRCYLRHAEVTIPNWVRIFEPDTYNHIVNMPGTKEGKDYIYTMAAAQLM